MSDGLLQAVPGIYQALVKRAYEVRLTMIGQYGFAAKILAAKTNTIDWRKAVSKANFSPIEVPAEVTDACRRLMHRLGIVFGCFDFIVTPRGDYVFLEVNEMGQFLFVESHTGLPMLDAFCELLRQGRPDFQWSESRVEVRLQDFIERYDDLEKSKRTEQQYLRDE